MIVFDTNLLVRLATNDVPADRQVVVALLEGNDVFISKTVLLETEWVLRSRYDYSGPQVMNFLDYLAALPSVLLEDEATVFMAMESVRQGLDFADALHLASAGGEPFYTLDRVLHRKAKRLSGVRVELLRRGRRA